MTRGQKLAIAAAALLLMWRRGSGRRPPFDLPWLAPDFTLDTMEKAPRPWSLWQLPVPSLNLGGLSFEIEPSNDFHVAESGGKGHYGVDLMYPRRGYNPMDAATIAYPPGSNNGSTRYFAPPHTPILAARDARVWSVQRTPRGIAIVLDHGAPWATFYQHLDTTSLDDHAKGKRTNGMPAMNVQRGQQIGTMGWDPTDPAKLRHLHFAVWYDGKGDDASVNPIPSMEYWSRAASWSP